MSAGVAQATRSLLVCVILKVAFGATGGPQLVAHAVCGQYCSNQTNNGRFGSGMKTTTWSKNNPPSSCGKNEVRPAIAVNRLTSVKVVPPSVEKLIPEL